MKNKTRNQLLGVIVGMAVAFGISLLPGLSGQARMWVTVVCVFVILRIFKLPSVIKLFTRKVKDNSPEPRSPGPRVGRGATIQNL